MKHARRLVAAVRAELPRLVNAVDEPEMERAIARVMTAEIKRLNLARIAAMLLTMLTRAGRHQRFLDEMLPVLAGWLSGNREEMKLRFRRRSVLKYPGISRRRVMSPFRPNITGALNASSTYGSH